MHDREGIAPVCRAFERVAVVEEGAQVLRVGRQQRGAAKHREPAFECDAGPPDRRRSTRPISDA